MNLQETSYQLDSVRGNVSLVRVDDHQVTGTYPLDPEKTHIDQVGGVERFEVPANLPCRDIARKLNESVLSRLEGLASDGTVNTALQVNANKGQDEKGNPVFYTEIQFCDLRFLRGYLPEGLDNLPEQLS